jgi:hypothetical protein
MTSQSARHSGIHNDFTAERAGLWNLIGQRARLAARRIMSRHMGFPSHHKPNDRMERRDKP